MPIEPGRFDAGELASEPLVPLVGSDAPLARAAFPPVPDEIARLPLIAQLGGCLDGGVEAWLRVHGASPCVAHAADSKATAHALVGAGLGVAVLPRSAAGPTAPRLSWSRSASRRRCAGWRSTGIGNVGQSTAVIGLSA
jgi:DNA-binding transcriptional LysR family regulator